MADPTVTDLIEVLQARAEASVVPTVPIESLLHRGHESRRARSRRMLVAVSALVAAVTITVLLVTGRGDDPRPTPAPPVRTPTVTQAPTPTPTSTTPLPGDLPEGAWPKIAYWVGQTVYDGGQTIDLESSIGGVLQGPSSIFVTTDDTRIVEYRPDGSSHLVTNSGYQPITDSSGEYLAWEKPASSRPVVVVRRLDGSEADRVQTFPITPGCCDNPFALFGLTDDGRVIAGLQGVNMVWMWDFAHNAPVRRLSGLPRNAYMRQVIGDRLVVDGNPRYAIGGISGDGHWQESPSGGVVRSSFKSSALWSPDGKRVVYFSQSYDLVVYDEKNGVSHRIDVPIPGEFGERFEDAQHLLIVVGASRKDAEHRFIVRCDVAVHIGHCERVASVAGEPMLAN